ncbi:hypothetical protein AvCA_50010 [Azotobacter vinelandii CA]|uniref:Uncharacterized protein n=2 Tax=Azotobacter vinelandii TaxID=354 RepID=C1DL99_AZOVD|nr:hypothetical protein Avin_50010 [Azotobacter vinelandii DJ]AGK15792.1 hypothetical protein AvCA_50010 [Azotobacter vinelandii CA]AGK22360.1 hypothetical protein AvCA6_50010 [Azotobacter vinelandii CA6]
MNRLFPIPSDLLASARQRGLSAARGATVRLCFGKKILFYIVLEFIFQ